MPTLRELREAKGLSQSELAERVGVDRATISRWEHAGGWGVQPGKMALLALAQVLGIDPSAIEIGNNERTDKGRPPKHPG